MLLKLKERIKEKAAIRAIEELQKIFPTSEKPSNEILSSHDLTIAILATTTNDKIEGEQCESVTN